MIITKQNWFKRSLAALLVLVMSIGIVPISAFTAFAEDSSEKNDVLLSPGTYVTTLYRQTSCTDDTILKTATEHFSAPAILTINDNGNQSVTIGVEHWSLYDAFIPAKQEYNSTGFTNLPSDVFYSGNTALSELDAYLTENANIATADANAWYSFSNDADKYGVFSAEYNSTTDLAYVTFEIADYTQFFAVQGWFNAPIDGNATKSKDATAIKYNDLMVFRLDADAIDPIDLNADSTVVTNQWSHVVRNSSLRYSQSKGKLNYFTKNMTLSTIAEPTYRDLVDTSNISCDNGKISVSYHLNLDSFGLYSYSGFQTVESSERKFTESELYQNWDYWKCSGFKDLNVGDDGCIMVEYDSLKEAVFGKNIYCQVNATNRIAVFSLCLSPVSDFCIQKDDATGIYIMADRATYSKDYTLEITKNQISDDYYTGINSSISDEYNGISYKNPEWYTVAVKNTANEYVNINNVGNAYFRMFVPLPQEFTESSYHIGLIRNGEIYANSEEFRTSGNADYIGNYLRVKSIFGNAQTVAIMNNNPSDNVHDITEDGLYTVDVYLTKENKPSLLSMADAAFNRTENGLETRQAYIYVKDGVKKLYFKLGTVARDGINEAYIGDLFCNNIDVDNEVYWDSVSYTDFALDENGNIKNNAKYDAITEWACLKGGILTLRDECYKPKHNIYELAVAAPIMAEVGEATYEEIENDPDSLKVWLRFYNFKKCDTDVTLDTVLNEYGYGYQPSALLRKIKYAQIFSAYEYTEESYNALADAVKAAQTVYNTEYANAAVASNAYEEHIALLNAAVNALEESTELKDAKDALGAVIESAKEVVIGDKTESAYATLQAEIASAESVYNNMSSNISDLNAAAAALEEAITAFQNSESASTLDKNHLADGVYSIHADMIKMDRASKSMADNAINHTVKLEVIDGEYFVTLDFRGITIENRFGYLKNLSYYADGYTYGQYGTVEGTLVSAEVLSTQKDSDGKDVIDQYNDANNLYPDLVKIKLVPQAIADEDGYVPLHVFVPIMEAIAAGNGDQDVLMKLDWSTLKETTEEDPGFQPEEPVEQSPAVDITDAATGVKVHADKGVFEEGVKLVVTPITSGADYDLASSALEEVGKKFKLYEIHFEDADGNEVQPNGTVTVSYPIPAGYDAANVMLYRINEDGSKTLIKGNVDGSYYTVITKSFSNYALVEKDSTITDEQNTQDVNNNDSNVPGSPQTGDNSNIMLWFLLALASAGMLCVLTFTRKRRVSEGE